MADVPRNPSAKRRAPRKPTPEKRAPQPIEVSLDDLEPVPARLPPPLAPALQRRQFTRVPYVTLIRLQRDDRAKAEIARIEDLSEGGVRLRCTTDIPVDALVEMRFALPITGEPAILRATVRWATSSGSHHVVGVSFAQVPEATRQTLVRYVTVMSPFGP